LRSLITNIYSKASFYAVVVVKLLFGRLGANASMENEKMRQEALGKVKEHMGDVSFHYVIL
jgi:hypothetical protein